MVGTYKYKGKTVSEAYFKKKVYGVESKAYKKAIKKSKSRKPVKFGYTPGTYKIVDKLGNVRYYADKKLVGTSKAISKPKPIPKKVIPKPTQPLPMSTRFFTGAKQRQKIDQRMSRRDAPIDFRTRTVAKPTTFKPLPISTRFKAEPSFLTRTQRKSKPKYKAISIEGVSFTPKNKIQQNFYTDLKSAARRDAKLKAKVQQVNDYLKLNIKDKDRWYTKALKGAGQLGTGIAFTGSTLANVVDKAVIQVKGVTSKDPMVKKRTLQTMGIAAKAVPKTVASSFDPRKPENWAGIAATLFGVRGTIKGIKTAQLKTTSKYMPSVRNAGKMKDALKTRQIQIKAARTLAKRSIKAKSNIRLNTKLLKKLDKLDVQIGKSIKQVNRIIKDPKTLKLVDMNPLIKTKDLIKNIGKDKHVFHATSASPSKLFGQKITKIKSSAEILKSVKKASGVAKRTIAPKSLIEKDIVSFIKKNKGVIGGGKAQNVFVKKRLTRPTLDYDVLIKGGSSKMSDLVSQLKKKYPNNKFQKVSMNIKGTSDKVYRLKVDGKVLVDFDPFKSGLKGVKLKTKTVNGLKVVDPELLALKKLEAVTNLKKAHRFVKDSKDLQRLTGSSVFKDQLFTKIKNPKKVMEVVTQRSGMGKSRIQFGETQLFFDFEVPTGYAYNALSKSMVPKIVIKGLTKLKVPKSFINKLDNLKYIDSNARFTVLKLKAQVNKFPSALQKRVKLASKGKLSIKETNKLRTDLNTYINKNPGKLSIGSRTGSRILGEREAVLPVKTKILKTGKKISIDPETKLFIDVVETSLKKSKVKTPKTFKTRLKALTIDKFTQIKKNFSKGDLSKVNKYQRQLKKAGKLTSGQYLDLIEITKKMLISKKGAVKKIVKKPTPKGLRVRRTTPRVRKVRAKEKITEVSAALTRSKRKTSRKVTTKRKVAKIKRKPVKSRVTKPRVIKPVKRRISEPRPRPSPRLPEPRKTKRPKRTPGRPPKRPTPRPRPPTPRPPTRPGRPKRPIREVPRPRRPGRPPKRPPVKIPIKFKVRKNTKKWEEEVIKWLKSQKKSYRPSLAAILFNITGYKVPKSVTGLEIRPVLIKRK